MKNFDQFTGLYSLPKTLRFELKPVGKTLENIEKSGLLDQDQHRADSYKKVKKIIDDYHKDFIGKALENFELNYDDCGKLDSLKEFYFWYMNRNADDRKKKLEKIQDNLRKQIAKQLKSQDAYKRFDKKELIKEDLITFVGNDKDKKTWVEEFKDFTTYFKGFNENRQNMYSEEAKSTSIAYRLIHENLPKFIDNINSFSKVQAVPEFEEKLNRLYKDFEPYLNVESIADMFKLDYYSMVLTQKQIDVYNAVIGGRTEEQGIPKIQGLNEYINLYNQQQKDKTKRLPKLKVLFKQILSDREAISWLPEAFKDSNEVLENVEKCYQELNEKVFADGKLPKLFANIGDYNLANIYITNDNELTNISKKLFDNYYEISQAIENEVRTQNQSKKKEDAEAYDERIKKLVKGNDSFSIAYINECLNDAEKRVEKYFKDENGKSVFERITNAYNEAKDLLNCPYPEGKNLVSDKMSVEKLKNLLDAMKELQRFVKPLCGSGNEAEKDEQFYGEFTAYWDELNKITSLYNKVRNYVTQKPYSEEKIKLNFNSGYFLSGWVPDYETKAGLLFEKDGLYYLAVTDKKLSKEDKSLLCKDSQMDLATRIILDFQKPDNKNTPRLFIRSKGDSYAPAVEKYKLPIKNIIDIYDSGKFKTEYRKNNPVEYQKSLYALIDYFKEGFTKHDSYKHYNFKWKETKQYNDIAEFYHDVMVSCYQIKREDINWNTMLNFVAENKLYLFQIYNKDFSPFSKGTPNMHTLYWKMLFDEKNLVDVVYMLNGGAEVFYRKKSINVSKPTHSANQPIKNKNVDNPKKESVFNYDLIKDKRYTVDKFQFHVPITMNFKAPGTNDINPLVNEYLKHNEKPYVIGIDRGERHLLYLSLIDATGKIVEQYTMNEIVNEYNGNTYKTNYHTLLDAREKNRDEARKSWQTIENIKELKEGYLSQVIHKITRLMVKYNAIVVLEDLNLGFMRGRQKVEKQVYQKFEKMLIDKLNYFVDKKALATADGGVLKAYQLTNKFESFKKLGKQSGFLFYIPAWNTSKMDPVTGFVNLFNTRYENVEKAKLFFSKFDTIKYNTNKGWFELSFDYNNFTTKAEGTRAKWTICTFGERIETRRDSSQNNQFVSEEFNLTQRFKDFFKQYDIDYNGNIKEAIANQTEKKFFEGLLHLLHLTLQMRNSKTGTEIDYMISPVADSKGKFYDSRKQIQGLPDNADANGAYNIARKGLWIIEQIKQSDDLSKLKFAISNKEWLQYVQQFNK